MKVVLTVTSGKAQDVMNLITGHVASSNAAVMKYDAVNSVFFSRNVTGITSITITDSQALLLDPLVLLVLLELMERMGPMELTGLMGLMGLTGLMARMERTGLTVRG